MSQAQITWEAPRPQEDLKANLLRDPGDRLGPTYSLSCRDAGDHVEFYSSRGNLRIDVPWWVLKALLASRGDL